MDCPCTNIPRWVTVARPRDSAFPGEKTTLSHIVVKRAMKSAAFPGWKHIRPGSRPVHAALAQLSQQVGDPADVKVRPFAASERLGRRQDHSLATMRLSVGSSTVLGSRVTCQRPTLLSNDGRQYYQEKDIEKDTF